MNKLIIFTDSNALFIPGLMIKAVLQTVSEKNNIKVAGVCTINFQKYRCLLFRHARILIRRNLQYFFDYSRKQKWSIPQPINIDRLSRKYGFQVLIPPDENINHPEFIRYLKTEIKPAIALSVCCSQKFSPELLEVFEYTTNYHNGLLPKYKGLKATCWSVYHEEKETGFTFHRMNENFDEGEILIQSAIPVTLNSYPGDLEYEKTIKAVGNIPRLLEIIIRRDLGFAQAGKGSYFSENKFRKIITINNPGQHSSTELMRRLKAFGILIMNVRGSWYDITKLVKTSGSPQNMGNFSFRACDGVILQATRFYYLPFAMYRILRQLGWPLPSSKKIITI